jgi:hypothetical protein
MKQLFFLSNLTEVGGVDVLKIGEYIVQDKFNITTDSGSGKGIYHTIVPDNMESTLNQDASYLGNSYLDIANTAYDGAGSSLHRSIIRQIIFTTWEGATVSGVTDYPRGTLQEWIDAGKPTPETDWAPAHRWQGHNIDVPTDEDIDE